MKYEVNSLNHDSCHQWRKPSMWIQWSRSRPYLLDNKWNTNQNRWTVTLFIRALTPSGQVWRSRPYLLDNKRNTSQYHSAVTLFISAASQTRIWHNISEIRGKITQPRQWSSVGGSHRCKSDGAGLGNICWIINEIRVPDRDFVHQSVNAFEASPMVQDDASPTMIWRNISEIRGKITQPGWWSSMKTSMWVWWCRSYHPLIE